MQSFAAEISSLASDEKFFVILNGTKVNRRESCGSFVSGKIVETLDKLKSDIEEADQRLILHIHWCLRKGRAMSWWLRMTLTVWYF